MKLRDWLFGTLRRQLAVGIALVHAVMMSVFVFDLVVRQQDVLQARQVDEARSLARTLALSARAWVLTRDLAGLAELTAIDGENGVEYMMLTDGRGEVLAHTDPARVGQHVADMGVLLDRPVPETVVLDASARLADVAAPVVAAGRATPSRAPPLRCWACRAGSGSCSRITRAAALICTRSGPTEPDWRV